MPKEVSAMCFFLPQVHGHKAQFPPFTQRRALACPFLTKINVLVPETRRVITEGTEVHS